MSAFRIEHGIATLIRGHSRCETRYRLHVDIGGRAVFVELEDLPEGLTDGDTLRLLFKDGAALDCQVLDDTSMCTIVGDGLRRSV